MKTSVLNRISHAIYPLQDLFRGSVVNFISLSTGSRRRALLKKVTLLQKKIKLWVKYQGMKEVCSRIKKAEKAYLMGKPTKWVSLKHFSGPGITPMATKTLLSIHKNMRINPIFDSTSILHKPKSVKRFLRKYYSEIQFVLKHPLFTVKPYGGITVKSNRYWKTTLSSKKYNPFTFDPTVDSNNRTGGKERPLQVSLKGRSNGNCLTSQFGDWCALQRFPLLIKSISYLYDEWKWNLTPYILGDHDPTECLEHTISKIFLISDKSCKTRPVAIFDTFSQTALRPVHKMIADNLNNYHRDFTSSHLKGIRSLLKGDHMYYSIDLSKATDTVPAELSFFILKNMVRHCTREPKRFTDAVRKILKYRPFYYGGKKYFYSTGQPMGAYASFPLLAVTNHFITILSYYLSYGKEGISNMHYAIVGDDVVISYKNDPSFKKALKVGETYISLCNELGIPINRSKSVVGRNSFEFCKRFVKDGRIVSVPSWNAYSKSIRQGTPYTILSLLEDYGYKLPCYSRLISMPATFNNMNKRKLFSRQHIRDLISVTGISLPGRPRITRIPTNVLFHADRSLSIGRSLNEPIREVVSDCPYLSRLNYNNKIVSVLSKYHRRLRSLWKVGLRAKCNTFYLGYVRTYLDRRVQKRLLYSTIRVSSKIKYLRHYAMTRKTIWTTVPK